MINIKHVTKNYHLGKTIVPALRGIDLQIDQGDFVTIAGSSGSGKSTLLQLIGCLDYPTSGEVWIHNTKVSDLREKALNRIRLYTIGFIFQSFNLIPVLNVYENVELPLLIMKEVSPAERKERVNYFIQEVGLSGQAKHKPSELSGGQRQRVAIARALVTKPKLVLADEPTANLDFRTGMEIIDLMQEINRREQTTFIFSTHDPKVMQKANRIFHLQDGVIESEGKS
ncbi:ABC transporter ATP-binding protein [Paenibacillus sp. chi10]|uniref:ABC transporter ATP-binding protein n=1 Tax=Paenibacillus suaedae TaxID=3077233 RepID=A0AAJ2JZP8_9BACL|nr:MULTISPECIES: ABC transporter ATP-binding protein [unclassified Paenibacillus]MDT8977362.1 ABC transporter ATP-binding protein [Paenibacillus sp. chi10]GAV11570.1 ABC transporter [Paenibacillus sp. NAIST15-1]